MYKSYQKQEKVTKLFLFSPQGYSEARGDADGPSEENNDKRPANEGTSPQQERPVSARITPKSRFLSAKIWTSRSFFCSSEGHNVEKVHQKSKRRRCVRTLQIFIWDKEAKGGRFYQGNTGSRLLWDRLLCFLPNIYILCLVYEWKDCLNYHK